MHLWQSKKLVLISALVLLTKGNYLEKSSNHCTSWCFQPGSLKNCSREIQCKVQEGYNAEYTYKRTAPSPRNFHLSYECTENAGHLGLLMEWEIKGSELGATIENWEIIIEERDGYSSLKTIKIGIFPRKQLPKEHMIHFKYFYVEAEKYPLFIADDVTYMVTLESIPFYSQNHERKELKNTVYIPKNSCKQQSYQPGEVSLTTTFWKNDEGTGFQPFGDFFTTVSLIIVFLALFIAICTILLYRRRKRKVKDEHKDASVNVVMIANLQNEVDKDFGHRFACRLRKDFELDITSNWEETSTRTQTRSEWYHDMIYRSSATLIINPEGEKELDRKELLENHEFMGAFHMAKEYALTHKRKVIFLSTKNENIPCLKNSEKKMFISCTAMTKLSQILRILAKRNFAMHDNKTIAEYVNEENDTKTQNREYCTLMADLRN